MGEEAFGAAAARRRSRSTPEPSSQAVLAAQPVRPYPAVSGCVGFREELSSSVRPHPSPPCSVLPCASQRASLSSYARRTIKLRVFPRASRAPLSPHQPLVAVTGSRFPSARRRGAFAWCTTSAWTDYTCRTGAACVRRWRRTPSSGLGSAVGRTGVDCEVNLSR